ncbi:MAG: YitT family protein [Bacilli bacterium]|nr:YitT family protein [Bacilli bacterium]
MKDTKESFLHRYFKWNIKEFLTGLIGILIVAFSINNFIVPNHLYTSGVVGIAQLLRSLVLYVTKWEPSVDIAGIINICLNIPLFLIAFKFLSKTFTRRTLVSMLLFSLSLTLIPIPEQPLVDEKITSLLIGGIMSGVGVGLVLQSCSSLGGTDIIGLSITKKNKNASVGIVAIIINTIIFGICGIIYGVKVMIYSIIYMVFENIMVDRMHQQNISCTATIFTKKRPNKIIQFVDEELDRDCTTWEGHGEGSDTPTFVTYVVLSKFELAKLERNMPILDPRAFIIKDFGVGVYGKYAKNLTDQSE